MTDNSQPNVFTVHPFAVWKNVGRRWLCVFSADRSYQDTRVSNAQFNSRYPILGRT